MDCPLEFYRCLTAAETGFIVGALLACVAIVYYNDRDPNPPKKRLNPYQRRKAKKDDD